MSDIYGRIYHVVHPKDPELVRYIGKTTGSLKKREQGHWSDVNRPRTNSRFQNWLGKYKDDREIIEFREAAVAHSSEELNELEIREIAKYRALGQADLNITSGGDGGLGLPWSEESKAKLRKTLGGEGAWKAKLTWPQVRDIRRRYLAGEPWSGMLDEFGIARGTMQKIARNATWVDEGYTPPTRNEVNLRPKVTSHLDREAAQDLRLRAQREQKTYAEWALEYRVGVSVVSSVLQNKSHVDPDFNPRSTLRRLKHRPLRVLSEKDVVEMRDLARRGASALELSERYQVTTSAIRGAVRGTTWAEVPNAVPEAFPAVRVPLRQDPEAVSRLQERYLRGGVSTAKLAKEYGVSVSTMRNALLFGPLC